MHNGGFFDDETIGVEFANVLTRICIADFSGFIRIEPDFAFAATKDLGGKGLLTAEIGHCNGIRVLLMMVTLGG
jgi:hypothetical protein